MKKETGPRPFLQSIPRPFDLAVGLVICISFIAHHLAPSVSRQPTMPEAIAIPGIIET